MSEAVFGLVGVVLGGVLNGGMTYLLDRRRDQIQDQAAARAAQASARLLLVEVSNTRRRIGEARQRNRWGPLQRGLINDEWSRHKDTVANLFGMNDWFMAWQGQRAIEEIRMVAEDQSPDGAILEEHRQRVTDIDAITEKFADVLINIALHGLDHRESVRTGYGSFRPSP